MRSIGSERNVLAASRGRRVARSQRVWIDMDSSAIFTATETSPPAAGRRTPAGSAAGGVTSTERLARPGVA
jgi:hypothetical protein